ncbi:MAG: phage tail sheath C-terminal domain-containing protein [Aminipila sp.]
MADIGLPNVSLVFTGLGTSAVKRGSRGVACLIISDDTDKTFDFVEYTSIDDLTSNEIKKYTTTNLQYIKDVLAGIPSKLIVARRNVAGTLPDILAKIKGKKLDWIGLAEAETADQTALATWIKSVDTSEKKKYKCVVYNATTTDDIHVVNFANSDVTFIDARGKVTGEKFVSRLIGMLAGLPLTRSAISYSFTDLKAVTEPADLASAVNTGKFVLYNDENIVRVARGVNSLVTTGDGVTDDFKHIMIIETQDLIYNDIITTWKDSYKGKYKNSSDNQHLLIGAINSYFKALEKEGLLDDSYNNLARIDVEAQRTANVPKYGADIVATWDDAKVLDMTVGTQVYIKADVKILNAMEDFSMIVSM